MNKAHEACGSDEWRQAIREVILPWAMGETDLGDNVLEVGPGHGLTTDLLRGRAKHLTCVEIDRGFADALARRTAGSNVTVLCEDATAMSLASAAFDGAVSLTMLRAGRCGTAFMGYLRVGDEMLRSIGPDLTGYVVIPGAEKSGEPGINRAAVESIHVRHHT